MGRASNRKWARRRARRARLGTSYGKNIRKQHKLISTKGQ